MIKPKIIFTALAVALSSLLFTDCFKKGKDDPLISLRTRKARVVGNWHMVSGIRNVVSNSNYNLYSSTWSYTRDSYVVMYYDSKQNYTNSGEAKFTLEFKKDGTVKWQRILEDQLPGGLEGTWDFGSGVGDAKKKEFIYIHNNGGYGYQKDYVYKIKELRNKKMVISREQEKVLNEEFVLEQD